MHQSEKTPLKPTENKTFQSKKSYSELIRIRLSVGWKMKDHQSAKSPHNNVK